MGSSASKHPRSLPKSVSKTPSQQPKNTRRPTKALPSESRNADIARDAGDPHLLSNLSKLNPVKVDHHMQAVQTAAASQTQRVYQNLSRSEAEASASNRIHNRLNTSNVSSLLSLYRTSEREDLARLFDLDIDKLERLGRYTAVPSVDANASKWTTDKNGQNTLVAPVVWLSSPRTS